MFLPTNQQMRKAANLVAKAEEVLIENKVLRSGLKLTEEEFAKAKALADVASKSGDPTAFLMALASFASPPTFFPTPCFCWWCRLKRFARRIGQWVARQQWER